MKLYRRTIAGGVIISKTRFSYNRQARVFAIESALQIIQPVVYVCHATKTWRNWHAYTHVCYAAVLPERSRLQMHHSRARNARTLFFFFVPTFTCEILIHHSINAHGLFSSQAISEHYKAVENICGLNTVAVIKNSVSVNSDFALFDDFFFV